MDQPKYNKHRFDGKPLAILKKGKKFLEVTVIEYIKNGDWRCSYTNEDGDFIAAESFNDRDLFTHLEYKNLQK